MTKSWVMCVLCCRSHGATDNRGQGWPFWLFCSCTRQAGEAGSPWVAAPALPHGSTPGGVGRGEERREHNGVRVWGNMLSTVWPASLCAWLGGDDTLGWVVKTPGRVKLGEKLGELCSRGPLARGVWVRIGLWGAVRLQDSRSAVVALPGTGILSFLSCLVAMVI